MNKNSKSAMGGEPVDPKLVHKNNIDNILISNLRRSLPIRVDAGEFDSKIFPHCSQEEKEILSEFYLHTATDNPAGEYRLKGVAFVYTSEEAKSKLSNKNISKDDIRVFLTHYKRSTDRSHYHLIKHPHENILLKLASMMGYSKQIIPDPKKAEISEILDKYDVLLEHDIFYANMIIDTSHYYFFEHPNDHIPGMMLVEAVRQLLVACTHKYGKVPLSGYNFILSSLAGSFNSYLELNYPVLLKVIQTDLRTYNSGTWANADFQVHVYQNKKENAVLNFQEAVIANKVFKRLRNTKKPADDSQWFILRENIEHQAMIRSAWLPKTDARIQYLSHDECIFTIDTEIDPTNADPCHPIEFFMYFSKVGFVHGTANLKSENKHASRSVIHVDFKEMEKADKTNLQEAIKKYGYLTEEPELLRTSGTGS